MAEAKSEAKISAPALAQKIGVPQKYLRKIVRSMADSGNFPEISRCGRGGNYAFDKAQAQLIADVVKARKKANSAE